VILSGYWQTYPPEAIKTAILADWADTLEDWEHRQIVWALRKWRNENPNKKPNPGHILSILLRGRGLKKAKEAKEAKEAAERSIKEPQNIAPVDPERKAEIDKMVKELFPTNRPETH
jgi:hypothetical protein